VETPEESEIVVSPALEAKKMSLTELPENGKLLASLRAGDKVNATVVRSIAHNVYLCKTDNIFRSGPSDSLLPVRAALRSAGYTMSPGTTVVSYVVRAEPNSARLTLSLQPVSPETLKKQLRLFASAGHLYRTCEAIWV
ncbi:MAG: hypothetical protein AAGI44_19655, partial [Pseudomonadota bacterium]